MFGFLVDLFGKKYEQASNHIDKLPDELFVEIFKKLDQRSLKKASGVCKRWNSIVINSPDIIQKLVIRVKATPDPVNDRVKVEKIPSLGRKHIALYIFVDLSNNKLASKYYQGELVPPESPQVFDVFTRHGSDVVILRLINLTVDPVSLRNIFESLPLLRSLEIGISLVKKNNKVKKPPVVLRKLRHIKFKLANVPYGFHWEIFEMIRAPCLRSMAVASCIGCFDLNAFTEFISESRELEKIEMNKNCFLKSFARLPDQHFGFNISHLGVNGGDTTFNINDEDRKLFHNFIRQHRWTLQRLFIRTYDLGHEAIDLREFPVLQKFSTFLGTSTIPNKNYYNMGFHKNGSDIEFMGYFKNLQMAKQNFVFPDRLTSMKLVFDLRRSSNINSVTEESFPQCNWNADTASSNESSLKDIEFTQVQNVSEFIFFLKQNQFIEKITIYSIENFDEIIDSIIDHPNVKYLRFNVHQSELKDYTLPIYYKIKTNYRNIHQKLGTIGIRPIYPRDCGKLIEFNFPDKDLKKKLKTLKLCSENKTSRDFLFYKL